MKRVPAALAIYRVLRRIGRELAAAMIAVRFRRRGFRLGSKRSVPLAQYAPRGIAAELPFFVDHDALLEWLRARRLAYREGGFTVYVPPQPELASVFPALAERYPPDAGIKFLKDLGPVESSRYVPVRSAWANNTWSEALAIGPPTNQLADANALYMSGLGPRVYDLVSFRSEQASVAAFIVEHVEGSLPNGAQCRDFRERLNKALASKQLAVMLPRWSTHLDFRCPSCNGNLIANGDGALYVDFQTFRVRRQSRRIRNLVNGEGTAADVAERWEAISAMLEGLSIDLAEATVLDLRCESGLLMGCALNSGVRWAFGWDRPADASRARELLLLQGQTRFDVFEADFSRGLPLIADISRSGHTLTAAETVILAPEGMRGRSLTPALLSLPWTAVVCEGEREEQVEDLQRTLDPVLAATGAEIRALDGGKLRSRPLAVLHTKRDSRQL
jgi:hypothetical protein